MRKRPVSRTRFAFACVVCLLLGLGVGAACQSATSGSSVVVNYRQGPASLDSGNHALIVFREDLLDSLVHEAVARADLPFQVYDLRTTVGSEGITLRGSARGTVLHVPYDVSWSGTAVVTATASGQITVTLANVRGAGAALPSLFSRGLASVLEDRLNQEVAAMPGFRVQQVEVSHQELYIYLEYAPNGSVARPS